MNKKGMGLRSIISMIVLAMFFFAYNVSLFVVYGFLRYNYLAYSGIAFWASYAFVVIAFATAGITFLVTLLMKAELKDAFLRLPIFIHSITFLALELVVSSVFMAIVNFLGWDLWYLAIPAQLILLVVHIAIVISCFFVKGHIKKVDEKVKDKTNFIKLLKVDVDVIAETAVDAEVRDAYLKLSEQVRYSDPMSHESLFELEKQILECLDFGKRCVEQGKNDAALENCQIASRMLFERNEKTRALK